MNKQAEEGNKRAKRILQLMNNPKTITTYQVLTTMFAFFACAFAYQKFAPSLIGWMETFMPIHHTCFKRFCIGYHRFYSAYLFPYFWCYDSPPYWYFQVRWGCYAYMWHLQRRLYSSIPYYMDFVYHCGTNQPYLWRGT